MDENKFVLDTSIIIDGKASELVLSGEISEESEIIVPVASLDELQAQASRHREEGFSGLRELTRLRKLCEEKKISFSFTGERPSIEDVRLAKGGRIDALIRDVALSSNATLLTADYVQALVGEAQGVKVRHYGAEVKTKGLEFESYFDNQTMSLHLKEGVRPYAKKGVPGNFTYTVISDIETRREDLERMAKEISEASRVFEGGSIEISRRGATVIQLGQYRVAIARPPFSDGIEITIVRPLVRLSLGDYSLSEKLEQRLGTKAEGVLIAGPPGSGKSTLASSLADFYLEKLKVVKTFESPRDLQVAKGITQYGPLEGDFEKTAEILLLVRPDYTIFDEVRRTKDFEIFADMRLAGVGMVGVVHASDPINAVQRFMGRIELGMVPHIVDTVIFVKSGKIEKVLELSLVVKVPSGMNEPDLARPVVEVREFESGKLAYEIYTFGEENVIIPVDRASPSDESKETALEKLAKERILQVIRKFDSEAQVTILSPQKVQVKIKESMIPRIIGKGGSQIKELEELLKVHIDVEPKDHKDSEESNEDDLSFDLRQKGENIELLFAPDLVGTEVRLYSQSEMLLQTRISNKGKIKIPKRSETGQEIMRALRLDSLEIKKM
ncbi:MAG: ATPase, T2SS/T4P/T4SS family [Nitrososphaerales archaeon]